MARYLTRTRARVKIRFSAKFGVSVCLGPVLGLGLSFGL